MKLFKYTTVGILLLASGLFFTFGNILTQTPAAHAQAGLISAFGQGAAEGIGSCAAQFVSSQILGGITSRIKGAVASQVGSKLGISQEVPVIDRTTRDKIQEGNTVQESRESCLDGIMYATAQNFLDQLADSTLHWVNSGFTEFGQPGNRAYIGDLESFINNVGEQTFNQFVDEFERTGNVCNSFSGQVLELVTNQHFANNPSPTGQQPSDVIGSFDPNAGEGCELESLLGGEEATEAFLKGDFSAGGWEAFLHTANNPNSNPIGAYLSQKSQLQNRIRQAQELDLQELEQNNGWLSAVSCPGSKVPDEGEDYYGTGKCMDGEEPVVETPGTVVNEAVNNLVGSDFRRLELADETNEIVAALASQLVGNIIGAGGQESGGFFDPDLPNRTNPLSGLDGYGQDGGYRGPVPVEHIASTTAEQIALEEEILSILAQLPTRYELRRLEARINQCLVRDNPIPETITIDGQEYELEILIPSLFTTHQNIFPGSGQSGEREVGPQEVDWAGNDFDWTPGEAYGLDTCGGPGNFRSGFHTSYVADVDSGTWQAYLCLFDSGDEFGEDQTNFGASFRKITNAPLSAILPQDVVNGIAAESHPINFGERPLYRNPRNDRVKISWEGGDYEWEHHNFFAKEFPRIIYDTLNRIIPSEFTAKLDQILNTNSGIETNRYGASACIDNRHEGQLSYIVSPGEDYWTEQVCTQIGNAYRFIDTGNEFDAFRMLEDVPTTKAEYTAQIETLVGEETYDDSYEEPAGGDDLYELLHDAQTITAGSTTPAELSARKRAIDARFGRLFSKFHSEADLQAAQNALDLLEEAVGSGSEYRKLLDHADANSCQAPDGWDSAVSDDDGGDDGGDDDSNLISSFSATELNQGIRVQWQSSVGSCEASSAPPVERWNGPVGREGNILIPQSDIDAITGGLNLVYLRLTCSANGETDQRTYYVDDDGGGDDGGGEDVDFSYNINTGEDQFAILDSEMTNSNSSFRPVGIIDWNGRTRIYYRSHGGDQSGYLESENLYNWSAPVELNNLPSNQTFIWDEESDRVYCYRTEGGEAYMMNQFDPERGCQNTMTPNGMYNWGLDGTLAPTHIGGDMDFIQMGRVRGYDSQSTGGWGNSRPDYPKEDDFPEIKEAFEGTPYNAEDYIQDRRGLSLHRSDDGYEWSSEILLDPQDVDMSGFRGWTNRDANGIGDFYSAVALDSEKVLVKAFMKEKDRLIDREDYNEGIDVRRRFRFTGETIIIPAVLEGDEITLTSNKSVIPKEFHERVITTDQVSHATNPGVPEIGQMTPSGRVLRRDGKVFLTYYYRDDIHYEGGWDGQREGIYMYVMSEGEFNNLFN